ncbi:MAG: alanine--tRNA ligase [Candidatus Diapherotrites archaeon]|nr:alanine--tRNA ligase [Candidatus Diapherotrites archaeon]
MPKNKKDVMELLRKKPDEYWKVDLFEERGFKRQKCPSCGTYFWSINERENCSSPPCGDYEFIGKPPTKKSFDLIKAWRAIEKFFVKNGHTSINRYPIICRWFPGLFFTVASIVDFQRSVGGKPVFEFPVDPLVVPQPCLRFNDIPNIGVSGRHMSSFTMVGQHTKKYWKDRCIELDYELMTKVFGIPEDKIVFTEDIWVGPSAFGSSLEYLVDGLELGTSVFTSFWGTPDNFKPMDEKVIDMGAGLERFTWISQGTPTIYDASYGPVIAKLKKTVDYDKELFTRYSRLSGRIDADKMNPRKAFEGVAGKLGVSVKELETSIGPLQAVYAITDHAKALTFAIADSGLPSNVGGGYNLRVLLRRALNLISKYNLDFTLNDVCEKHAKYLKPVYPSLAENLDEINEILDVEKKKYERSLDRARRVARTIVSKSRKVPKDRMIQLYESQGVTPELLKQVAESEGKDIEIAEDFYSSLTAKHSKDASAEFVEVDAPKTVNLYYSQPEAKEFTAKVLKNFKYQGKNWVILDRTLFYAEKGGQDHDTGWLDGKRVIDVQDIGGVVLHQAEPLPEGKTVKGQIDWDRRIILRNHHSATHIINGACRRVLGNHIWQAGAWKGIDKAHLDITHYENLSQEQIDRIEKLANKVVQENRPVTQNLMPRTEAESKYGFRLYQGGAVPAAELYIVEVKDWDVEACGGTHVSRTGVIKKIVISGTEKIQDGIVRVHFLAGEPALEYLKKMDSLLKETAGLLGVKESKVPESVKKLLSKWKSKRKEFERFLKKTAEEKSNDINPIELDGVKAYVSVVEGVDMLGLREVSKKLGNDDSFVFLVSDRGFVFAAAGKNVIERGINAGKIVREITGSYGGGGGGPPEKGEGMIKDSTSLEQLVDDVKGKLRRALNG